MPKRKTKPRKQSAKSMNRKALKEWSLQVRERDQWRCAVCGSDKFVQSHHCHEKFKYPELKLDPMVGIALCAGCHSFKKYSAHHNPIWWCLWLAKNRPEQYQWLVERM